MARKILLADDSVTAQNMGRKILADAGYEVITVNNGSAALKKINEQRPDVIVLDVYMPGYSGLEVCQRLKETGETSKIPILLTVGKLEPFKPEEAKRVRADGFIVKPFEASELLSALTKLEDKIVPRQETSKPGRFSRAIASVEDPRLEKSVPYDKTMAIEEDSSWKNRIAFPSKGKKKEADDEPVHEQASKDLRDQMPTAVHQPEEQKVDLGALAPAGLPKDVTPEEIAALAAAAARVKGKIAEPAAEMSVVAPVESERQNAGDSTFEEYARVIPTRTPAPIGAPPQVESKAVEQPKENVPAIEVKTADVPEPSKIETDASLSAVKLEPEDEPVTIAAAAMAGVGATTSRWTAVSVALTPEETGISLEQEMQKAYAEYAAAETGHSGAAPMPAEYASVPSASALPAETASSEVPVSVPATTAPESVQPLSAVASAATEAVAEAVKELQKVAESLSSKKAAEPTHSSAVEPTASAPAEPVLSEPTRVAEEPAAQVLSPVQSDAVIEHTANASTARDTAPVDSGQAAPSKSSENSFPHAAEAASQTAHHEPDLSATTAAAWESWKRVQETGHGNGSSPQNAPSSTEDKAAMAAAVGGNNSLEELKAAAENDPAIASIVDSVLADLRPKIVEEISRKLGKKK